MACGKIIIMNNNILQIETTGYSGECGIYVYSRLRARRVVSVAELSKLVIPECNKYNVKPPLFEILPHRRRLCGRYLIGRDTITLNLPPTVGTVYHELAHHIAWHLYHDRGHGWWFKWVLQRIFTENEI